MTLDKLMEGIDYEIICSDNPSTLSTSSTLAISSITIDSRKVEEKGLFICLRGLDVDGHQYINDAYKKGAAAVIIDRDQQSYPEGLVVWKVQNTRRSLSAIAANFYGQPAKNLRLFGVTGTNGKTSVTYIMESILRQVGKAALIGTVGLRLDDKIVDIPFSTSTTPDPQELHQIFGYIVKNQGRDVIMEVSSHALALHKMEGLFFEVAMFTNLTQDHLDFHGTMENYLAAKAMLFGQCRYGVVNIDDKYSPKIMTIGNPEKWITYGIDNECDIRALHIKDKAEGAVFDIKITGTVIKNFYLPAKGRFNIYNALAAIGAALAVGISMEEIQKGITSFTGVPGRIQSVSNDRGFHVLVDYAHSPDGLVNIINAVRDFTDGRVITIFGCGGDRDVKKRPIMGRIGGELSDHCILTSDNPRSEAPEEIIRHIEEGIKETNCPYDSFVDRREAIFHGITMLQPGDALIIAGKGHEDYQIIGNQTLHFDDVEVAKEALVKDGHENRRS